MSPLLYVQNQTKLNQYYCLLLLSAILTILKKTLYVSFGNLYRIGKVKKKVKSGSKKDQDESEKGDLDINQGKEEDDEEEDGEEEEEVEEEEDEGGEEDEDDEVDKDDKDEDIMPGFFRSRSRTGNVEETHKMENEDDAHDADDEEDADDDYNEDSADDEDDEDDEDAEYDEEDEDEDEYYEEDDEGDGEDYYEEDYYDGDYSGDINTVVGSTFLEFIVWVININKILLSRVSFSSLASKKMYNLDEEEIECALGNKDFWFLAGQESREYCVFYF